MTNSKRLWITSLILGIAFDFLFWKKTPGISFAIYIILCLAAWYLLFKLEKLEPAQNSLWLLIPIVFFSTMTFIRQDPITLLLNFALTLFLMAVLAVTYIGGRWILYSISDYASKFFHLIIGMLSLPLAPVNHPRHQQKESIERGFTKTAWQILRGFLLALPILLIFTILLTSADLIFSQRLNNLINIFKFEKLPEYLFRGIVILFIAHLLAGALQFSASQSSNKKLISLNKSVIKPFLGFTEAAIILGSVLLLFSAFVIIQFQYFFSGQANIAIEGYTYSEYARRGFGELITVAVFSLMLLLGLSTITKRETAGQRKCFSGLIIGLVALVLIILVSAFQRLSLYETAYGFSRLRTYSHAFMIWLGILLITAAVLEFLHRQRIFTNAALLVLLCFTISLNLLNVDAFIVHQNINRAIQGRELDASYLSSLSDDAVSALVKEYSKGTLPHRIQDGVGAALACHTAVMKLHASRLETWQSFHLSHWNAERLLETVQDTLQDYKMESDSLPLIVVSPNGIETLCQDY